MRECVRRPQVQIAARSSSRLPCLNPDGPAVPSRPLLSFSELNSIAEKANVRRLDRPWDASKRREHFAEDQALRQVSRGALSWQWMC